MSLSLYKNKTVALVGGEPLSWEQDKEGRFDVVARVQACHLDLGGRCDAIYTLAKGIEGISYLGSGELKLIATPAWTEFVEDYKEIARQLVCEHFMWGEQDWFTVIRRQFPWPQFPLTGFVALEHIRSCEPECIYLTGMDLYQGESVAEHNMVDHARYLKKVCQQQPRIYMTERLQEVMEKLL